MTNTAETISFGAGDNYPVEPATDSHEFGFNTGAPTVSTEGSAVILEALSDIAIPLGLNWEDDPLAEMSY